MQVKVEQSVELGGDRAESEPGSAPSENCFGSSSPCGDKPDLIIDPADLPAAAYGLRDLLARSGDFFERGVPVKVVPSTDGRPPTAVSLTVNDVLFEAHRLSRPVKLVGDELVPVTLLDRLARMYLEMRGKWNLRPLAGVSTAPLLSADGSIRIAEGYDRDTRLYCANVPDLEIPERPTRDDAVAALRLLRETFRTFPFADAARCGDPDLGVEVVNADRPPGMDESAALVALLTAICRPSLPLAPGFLIRGPRFQGRGRGRVC